MLPGSRTFRIFISSTFGDLKAERNALQETVFPRIRDLCEKHGCRFQAIDLRWGVSEQESLNQETMRICLREINRCQQVTPRPNFIVLLGDRYGWRPLPEEIPACEFVEIRDQLKGRDGEELLTRWYRRDDNAVPPVYNLKPRDGIFQDYKVWERQIENPLLEAMRSAVVNIQLTDSYLYKIGASATHQEIIAGAFGVENAQEHIFCFFREIQGLTHDDNGARYLDLDPDGNLDHKAKKRLKELKNELKQRLHGNIHRYKAKWIRGDITHDHIDRLCEDVYERLSQIILREIERLEDVEPLEVEIEAHKAFGRERALNFIGRSEPLEAIDEYVGKGNCHPFAVWGESGCGKSALVAKSVQEVTEKHLETEVVYRFIGSTPDSSRGGALLEGLCREISQRYGANEDDIPGDYRELVVEFPKRLALATIDKPLVVFLDAADQLSDMDNARILNWLPADLPNEARIVISTTRGKCLDALQQKLPPGNIMELQPMTSEEGSELLDLWLTDAGRTLQPSQRDEVLNKFKQCRLPLYLKMAFEEARCWRSYDKIQDLSKDTFGIINDLLTRLSSEANHGEILVSHSLGYLATSKNGLSENEMLDLLSGDSEVLGEFRRRSPNSPLVDGLPVVLWSRLYADLEPYMAKRTADGTTLITFYHRQFRTVIENKFLGGNRKKARHSVLAEYFGQQSLYAQENDGLYANLRMLSELPYQQTHSEQWGKLLATLTNFHFLQVKVKAVGPQPLIEDYSEAFQAEYQSKPLASVQDLLRLSTHVVSQDPTQLASQIIGRLPPSDEPCIQNLLEQVHQWAGSPWLCPHLPSLITSGGPLLHTLMGHGDWVEAVVVTPDGQRLISASDDTTLKVWDLKRHEEVLTLTGHTGPVLDIALTPDGQKAVSSSADGTIKVWDLGRLVELHTLSDHSGDVLSVDITPDGNRILSGAADGALKVWDLERGEKLFELSGHTDWVRDVMTTPDGRLALSVSDDKTLRVWDLEKKTELHKILAHNERINAVAVTPDGRRAITASADKQIKVWDISKGKMLFPLSGHGDWVRALTVTPNGRQLISASDDQTLRVWDLEKETLLHILTGHTKAVWDVAVTQDGQQVISGSGDRTLKIWDLRRAGLKGPVFGHPDWGVTAVAVMPDGRTLVSGSTDKTLKVWDLERGEELKTLTGHQGGIHGLAVTPDGRKLISSSRDKTLIIWDMEQQGKILHTLEGHTDWVNAVAVTPDGKRIVSASHDSSLSVWDIEQGKELESLFGHKDDVTGVAIMPDGQHAISASWDKTLKFWDLEQGEEIYTLMGHEQGLRDVAVTPDGRWAISASDDMTLKLWDLRHRTEVRTFSGHKGTVWAVAVTPDGQRVLSGSEDKTLRLWNLSDGRCVAAFTAESPIRDCATAPNSVTFVAGENNARLHVLSLKEGQFTYI